MIIKQHITVKKTYNDGTFCCGICLAVDTLFSYFYII